MVTWTWWNWQLLMQQTSVSNINSHKPSPARPSDWHAWHSQSAPQRSAAPVIWSPAPEQKAADLLSGSDFLPLNNRQWLAKACQSSEEFMSEMPMGVHETSMKEHLTNFTMVRHSNKPKYQLEKNKLSNINECSKHTHMCVRMPTYTHKGNGEREGRGGFDRHINTFYQTKDYNNSAQSLRRTWPHFSERHTPDCAATWTKGPSSCPARWESATSVTGCTAG